MVRVLGLGEIYFVTCQANFFLVKYGFQGQDQGTEDCHLLNGICCNKMLTDFVAVKSHKDKYEKGFGSAVAYLSQYVKKKGPMTSFKFASIVQGRLLRSNRQPMHPQLLRGRWSQGNAYAKSIP